MGFTSTETHTRSHAHTHTHTHTHTLSVTHFRCHRDESPPGDNTAESTASVRINTQLLTSDSPSELCHTSSPSRLHSSPCSSSISSISPLTISFLLLLFMSTSVIFILYFFPSPPLQSFPSLPCCLPLPSAAFFFLFLFFKFRSPPPPPPPPPPLLLLPLLTTVLDVHVLQSYFGVSILAVQLLCVEPGLSFLLPKLDPADITSAVEHHAVQTPETQLGKKT